MKNDELTPDKSSAWHKGECACVSPDRYECYSFRYFPGAMEEDGRSYCECLCHEGQDDEDCGCYDCADERIV
jgi:hypothetical protein